MSVQDQFRFFNYSESIINIHPVYIVPIKKNPFNNLELKDRLMPFASISSIGYNTTLNSQEFINQKESLGFRTLDKENSEHYSLELRPEFTLSSPVQIKTNFSQSVINNEIEEEKNLSKK